MKEMINAWLKEPGKDPEKRFIPNSLEFLQFCVGGYIETVTLAEDLVIICDEEGRLKDKPYNCTICGVDFVGNIILAGVAGEEMDDCSMDEETLRTKYPQLWRSRKKDS